MDDSSVDQFDPNYRAMEDGAERTNQFRTELRVTLAMSFNRLPSFPRRHRGHSATPGG